MINYCKHVILTFYLGILSNITFYIKLLFIYQYNII